MSHGKVWSRRGGPVTTVTPSTKAISHTVMGAISSLGVVNVAMKEPGDLEKRKELMKTKRKAPGDELPVCKGTVGAYYMHFIGDTMDIMDSFPEMRGFHIVMDRAPIHNSELNPLEQLWSVIQSRVKRHPLESIETLTTRIVDAFEALPLQYLQNSIQYSFNRFKNCSDKELI